MIASIWQHARMTRASLASYEAEGVYLDYPYYDRNVVEACLSARPVEITRPGQPKPILVEALRHEIPNLCLVRTTKAHGCSVADSGVRRNAEALRTFLQDSVLAEMGLIDIGAYRRTLELQLMGLQTHYGGFEETLSTEIWLRHARNN
jgi:asparagine synthase (glutamine-hydrolysing)